MVIIGLFLTTVLIAGSGISCQTQAPESAPPAPDPVLPPKPSSDEPDLPLLVEWSADGVINEGEYLSEMTYDGYELFWINDNEFAYIAIRVKTTGFVALGIQPGSRMKDADMIYGFVEGGEVSVLDLFAVDNFGTHPPDTELGGTSDITSFGGQEADGYTVIEFKRALDTGDRYDNKLSTGKNKIIWSYGLTDEPTRKHVNRGYGEITITG